MDRSVRQFPDQPPRLSIIMPYYKKFREFERVLPLNAPFLSGQRHEIILVLDEPSEWRQVLQLIRGWPAIRWRVIVNDRDHAWRAPVKAINVGLRHAEGRAILICSPESVFITDVPRLMLEKIEEMTDSVQLGRVLFSTFAELESSGRSVEKTAAHAGSGLNVPGGRMLRPGKLYYGTIGALKESFFSVNGYDESLTEWGGDDDNLRLRMKRQGLELVCCDDIRILHLSFEPRSSKWMEQNKSRREIERTLMPCRAKANPAGWGTDFNRVAYDWRAERKRSGGN